MVGSFFDHGDAAAKRFEANQLFTPSLPIAVAEMFVGRLRQASRIVDAIGERGRHVILFGERGVGKSSMARIIPYFVPISKDSPLKVRHIRVQAFPLDTFASIARRIFHNIHFEEDLGEGKKSYNVAEFYPEEVTIDDFISEMKQFKEWEIPIIIIDEFNEVDDEDTEITLANALKALSDEGVNVTILIVGVADNVTELIARHKSIERCAEQVRMPRMSVDERRAILSSRLTKLDMTIEVRAERAIINLSRGLPAYVHSLGKFAAFLAINEGRPHIVESDVERAIDQVLESAEQTLKDSYEDATRSNHTKALFRHLLTACALAKCDPAGYFMPAAVREPYAAVLKRTNVKIANFQDMLRDFAEKREGILERSGEARSYRYRFKSPAMQPYVLMRAMQGNIIDELAMQALWSSDEPDLFSIF